MSELQQKSLRNFLVTVAVFVILVGAFFSERIRAIVALVVVVLVLCFAVIGGLYLLRNGILESIARWRIKGVLTKEEYEAFSFYEEGVRCLSFFDDELDEEIKAKIKQVKIPKGYKFFWDV